MGRPEAAGVTDVFLTSDLLSNEPHGCQVPSSEKTVDTVQELDLLVTGKSTLNDSR